MASFALKVASPRNLAGAFSSPKVSPSPNAALRRAQGRPDRPHAVSYLKKSPSLSPFVPHFSPYAHAETRSQFNGATQGLSKRSRSVRKLPWSDRDEPTSAEVQPLENSLPTHCDTTLAKIPEFSRSRVSVDTPNRVEMLQNFRKKQNLLNILGKGSFGTVIEASYKGKAVAAKIILPSPEAVRQLRNEANCLGFRHPNIVLTVKVVPPANDVAGVVIMDKIVGYTLQMLLDHDLLKNEILQRVRYSIDVCSALAYCHEHEVLHLDVKPQNILVEILTDTCKLCDFGCSSNIEMEKISQLPRGTAGYAAPEVLQGSKPSTAADVYSLGITMWQLLSGETPYKDMRAHAVIYKVVSSEYRPPIPVGLSSQDEVFLSLVKKCWSQNPHCRPSIPQILEDLQELMDEIKI